ncbi:hypothetical protein ABPG74_017732 [Tetrahymena malaccensis]
MLKNFFGIQNSNQEKKESKKITVYLQTPNNEFYQSKKISVQQVNQTKQKKLKAIDHYQDKKSHELLRNWEFYKQQNKNYLYFSNQIEIISNIQGGNDDILFVMFEEKILQFNLQEDTDILFIDSSTLEDKLYELDLYHQKQIGNECLIEFGLQLFLQESFTKLIKFGDYFQQKFERKQFLNLIIKLGFADIYRFDQFDIKKFLIFLFVQSIDEEQSIINPRIKICSILQNINESDKEKLSQISEQLKKFFDWERIKNFIEKFFEKEADYDKCKGYYKFKQVFQLRRSTYAIFESKIKSEFEPNFNDIFNEKYMEDSGMTIQNYYDLFKQQQNKINKQSAQRYLEINYPLIGFLAKKIDLQNFNNKTKIENAIGEIIKKVFQEKDVIQSQKLMNNTKKLFLSLPVDMEKIQEWINLNEKCQDIRFENIKSEEIQIFQDALNSSQIEIKTHFDMLLKIKIINFDQSSTQNILFDVIVSNLIKKLQQIQQQKPYLFRQQIANLFETLETLYTNNWNNLNIPEKIRQAIDFELKRVEIQSIFQQETDEFQESVFTSLIKKIDVISNLSIIINQLENAKKMTQLESQLEHMNNLLNTTLKAVIEQLERIKETTDFYKSLGYLNEERVKKLIFEKIKKKCINTLIRTLNNLIVDKKVKKIEEWDIQFVLNEQIFDLFFNLIEQTEEFEQSELFIQIQQIMQKFTNFGDMMNWKDYKIVCEKKNQLLKYTRCLKLSMQVNLEEYAQFYEKFSMVKYFIQLMKKLEAEGLESLKQQIESLDKQDSEDIKDVEQQFNKSFADNGSKLLQISQYLIELKLFDEISAICLNKKNTIFQTSLEIKTKAIPYIEILYQYFLGLEFFDRTNQFQDEDLKQFKNEQSIELKNFYQVINKYFKNHFNLNHQDLVKECQYLNKICEKRFEGFDGRISPEFFIHLIQQSYNRILDYELLRLIQKIAQDFSIQFPNKYKEFYDSFCALFSQHELSKEQFMNGSQNMSDQLDQFLHETTLKCNNTQIDRRTLKFDVIPFISSVLCVMRLYSHIKNNKYDEYLQELLFDDDEDLAKRVQYFNQIKQILQEFANITKNCDILEYIQEALQFFYSAKGQSKTLRQQIEDISKFDDYIKQKINDQKNSQAQNSVKVLQMFIQQAKIKIQIDEEFLQQSFSASANNSKDQMSTNLEQDDKKYYHATYITQKNVNKKQKQENFNEEEIFQVLQRLSIISKEQLDQAYKKEEEKQQFQDNRKIFEEIYNLIQNNLIQNLEKFIQLGYIDEFVSEVEININGGSVILQVIDEVKTLIKEKEKQINNWKDTIQMAQQKYPVMRLISPLNYPNLLRYFLGILDISLSQDSKVIKKNSITISERQFMKSNSVVKYNVEELISFYHMQPKDLESKIKTNQDQIKIKLVNEKIQVIGEYLNQLFKSGQETLKFKEISKLTKNAYDQLVAKKIECNSYGDMCKKLLNAFGNKKQCLDRLQFFFANDQTTETDIEIFLNRVIYFEMVNDDIPRYFFIVDFKKLRYQVLKFATDLIEYYMITDDEQLKTKNELFLLYLQNQKIYKSSDLDDQTIEDYMRIPLTKDFDKQTPQYQNVNLHLYQSQQAGDGKTYQIKETIKNKNQCYVNVPAHQFQNVKNLLKILRSKRKELIAQENSKIQGIHIEIIYDKQDKISLLLFQIVVLNCISYNQNQFFVFEPKSNFYIEKSNYYGIAYANIMDHINLLKEQNKFIEFNIQHLSVAKEANSDDQIMLRYLFGLQEGEQYFMGQDFVKFECFDDQYDQKINNLIFFNNESIIAAIFKDNSQEEGIKKLKELMKIFIQKCNQVAQRYENVQLELEKRVPNIDQTNDDYILIRTLIYVCSRNPNNYINEQNTEKNEKISKMKPDLINILQGKAFTKDNTCKLIQIAYKIYAGVPLVIMGETGIGKTVNIQILSQIMGFKFEILRLSAGTTVDQIISFMKNVKKELNDNSKVVIFFDEINTNQNIYGLLKEIFIEKSMNGKKISKNNQNIVCIAACNPYEYMRKNNRNNFEAGLLTRYQQKKASKATLTYHVYPLPESMLTFVVNYGQLEQSVEENNILQMLLKLETTQKFLQNELECIQKLIMTSQQFVRWQQESSRSCSLRDISRVIKFIQFFMESYFTKKENQDTKINNKQRAVILSLYLCYQLRLNQSQKDQYQQIIQYQLSQHSFFQKLNHDNIFNQIINEELNFFIDQIKIDSNFISKNKALKENCFCIAVCILTKVPLFITGEPGTSKTLSFTLVMNSFRGKSSESKFLKGYDSIKEFYIQGNLQIRSEEIKKAFYQAKNAKIEGILPVVFYDEAGQGEFSKHKANKCLHEELDENSVSFIASSNYSLDFAKQNRCLHLQRNKNSLEDLQEFVNQLVNSDTKLKKILIQFCEVYYDFHSQSKNYIHNSRDFYYTIKYCIFQFYTDPSMYQEEKYVVNLLYRAVIKNFSGYKENTNLIKQLFNKQFHQFKDDIQYNLNMLQIIQECFKPICKDFVYHSRFLMLITDNTDQGIEFARTSLEKNGFQPQVKAGSHFKKDIYEDKTREISSINASIEQNYSIISVNQDYIYAVYYDFFTMNFSKTGDKQRFRLNYKQIQTRVEVPQIYVFIMIVTVEQYMQMDLALINRFEKHIFTQNLMFSKKQKKILNKIIKEFDHIKLSFSKDQHFLSFIESSYISGLVQVECKKQVQKEEDLERICIDLIGNLAKKYDVVRLQSDKATSYFKDWNQKTYLDNLIEFAAYQKKLQTQQKQEKGFYSIIYTYSYLYNNYQALLKQKGYETMLVDLNSIKQKLEFQQQIEIYFEGKYNLVIIKISSQDENPQNIYYIRSYLDECRQKYQSKSQKSIIILIQHSDNNHYRLPFCSKWSQYQIDNLLPYVYTQSFIFNFQEVEIKEINNVLNYRNLYGKQVIKILENKRIFNYFTSMPGFSSKLVQRLQFRFDIDKEQFYQYYESARVMLEDHFQKQESFIYNDFFNYLTQYLKQATDQDDLWYQNFNLIKGFNYEKQLINYLKNQVENVLLTIFSQYEDLNLLTNFNQIQKLIQIQQLQYMNLFKQIRQQSIVISDSCDVKRIPHVGIKFIFSNFIYQKIENTKNKYESFNDVQEYQTYLDQELQIFQEILSSKNFIDYISDFLFYKEIKKYNSSSKESGYYSQFCDKLLSLLNEKQFFKEYFYIHVFFWNYERIFLEILELIQILKNPQYAIDLAQYLVSQEVFQNQKDILEAFSEFYYQILLNTNEIIEINKIEHFIKIFPQQSSSQRFQIINQCYKSFINYDKAINIKDLLTIFRCINSQTIVKLMEILFKNKRCYSELFITTIWILHCNMIDIIPCFEKLIVEIINAVNQNQINELLQVDINLILSYFFKQVREEVNQNFISNFNAFLNNSYNNILLKYNYFVIIDTVLQSNKVKAEDKFTQLLIRIGEITFQDEELLYSLNPNQIIQNFKQQEQKEFANVQFIFTSIYFRIVAKEISDIIKEGYEQNIFEKKRFENFNDISTFFMQISQQYDQTQVRNQYIQLYLLKLIYYENSNFFKQEIKNSSQNKKQEYTFIEQIQKLYLQSSFDPYEYPWCKENYIKKIENLEQIIQNSSNQKENFLVLSTLKMMKHNIGDQLFNQRQLQIFNTISNVKDQSSLSKFLIYLSSLTQENQFKQLNQLLGAQGSSYIQQIYVPFNSLSKQQAQALENKNVLECIVDRKNQYQCSCGYIYAVGDCGKNVVTLNCFNCKKKKIGGNDHKNIDKMYVLEEVQEKLGINLEFYEDLYLTPRQMDPLAFRFGNLVINCLLLISENQSLLNQKDCVQIITNQWKIIRSLLKLSDELLLIIAIELLNKFCKLNQKNFSILNNRNQFEQEFSKICQNFQQEMQSILQKFDNDAKNIKQKDQDELKVSEKYTLSRILENKPFLLKYYEETVRKCWNELCQYLPILQKACDKIQTEYLESSDKMPLENFLIIKRSDNTKGHPSDQLEYFIKTITKIQNDVLKELSQNHKISKNLFELYEQDMIDIPQSFNLENLIFFENLQLEAGQQKKQMNIELLKNYYIFDQISKKCLIKDFEDQNYFQFKKDTSNLGIIYSTHILEDYTKFDQRLNHNVKERFLQQCPQQEQLIEIREQLFFLHDLMKNVPKDKLEKYLENNLLEVLNKNGFINEEQYFKRSLNQFKVSHIFDLLVILETALMDNLVQNLEAKYKQELTQSQFKQFKNQFQQKINNFKQNTIKNNTFFQQEQQEVESKFYKELKLVLGRYIIRNIIPEKYSSNFLETNIFECISEFYDKQFFEYFEENNIDFTNLNIQHKYIYNLYEKVAQEFQNLHQQFLKKIEEEDKQNNKNRKNQQLLIFDFQMDKQQICNDFDNDYDELIDEDLI